MIHPAAGHGTLYHYTTFSCRGPLCRAASRWYHDTGQTSMPFARNVKLAAELCATFVEHGTYT